MSDWADLQFENELQIKRIGDWPVCEPKFISQVEVRELKPF